MIEMLSGDVCRECWVNIAPEVIHNDAEGGYWNGCGKEWGIERKEESYCVASSHSKMKRYNSEGIFSSGQKEICSG